MILFPHTRWAKYKTAWVWFHHAEYAVVVRHPPLFRRIVKYRGEGKELCKLQWDGDKPFITWKGYRSHAYRNKDDKGNRYLCPDGRVLGKASTWSCAYPERPLWYPRVDPFKITRVPVNDPPVVEPVIRPLGDINPRPMGGLLLHPNYAVYNGYARQMGDGVALNAMAHPVVEDPLEEDPYWADLDEDPYE